MIEIPLVVRIALAVSATYRMAELLTIDIGPFSIFERLRIFVTDSAIRLRALKPDSKNLISELADLLNCPFCTGVWVSVFSTFLVVTDTTVGNLFLLFMGIAGAQSFFQQLSLRGQND